MIVTDDYDQRTDSGTTTSTSYAHALTGATACEVAFTAPDDGEVGIVSRADLTSSDSDYAVHAIEVRDDREAVVLQPNDYAGGAVTWGALIDTATVRLAIPLTGLTPGAQYRAYQMFRVTSGTATIGARRLTVVREPTP